MPYGNTDSIAPMRKARGARWKQNTWRTSNEINTIVESEMKPMPDQATAQISAEKERERRTAGVIRGLIKNWLEIHRWWPEQYWARAIAYARAVDGEAHNKANFKTMIFWLVKLDF